MSLLSFILPDYFGEDIEEAISKIFSGKAGTNKDNMNLLSKQRILRAKKIMTPFVLRRKKKDVSPMILRPISLLFIQLAILRGGG